MQLFPTPPVDNLYKLMAFSGVAIVIACFVIPWQAEYLLQSKRFQAVAENAKAKADYEMWQASETRLLMQKQAVEQQRQNLQKFMDEHPRDSVPDEVAKALKERLDRLDQRNEEFWDEHAKTTAMAGVADGKIGLMNAIDAEIEFLDGKLSLANKMFWVGLPAGILFTIGGFALWYIKHQHLQDQILRAERDEKLKTTAKE